MLEEERRALAGRAGDLAALTPGRSGNASVRGEEGFAITPTGVPYDDLDAGAVSVVSLAGEHAAGAEPSSETPMHRRIYETTDAGAIVHAHPPWATTLAALREPLPPVHYALARAGTAVPVAGYATYGTEELAAEVASTMEEAGAGACLLANHGLVATGDDLDDALETAEAVEFTARVYCQARSIGDPVALPEEEIEAVARRFEGYGQDG